MEVAAENQLQASALPLREIALVWLLSRLLIFALVLGATSFDYFDIPAREGKNFNPTIVLDLHQSLVALKRVYSSADASWYFEIAENGYHSGPSTKTEPKNWVFFPLFPLLERGVNFVTHNSLFSGLLLANLAFLSALILVSKYFALLGASAEISRRALWLICFFPTTYFFSAPLTESPFLLLLVATWLLVERGYILASGMTALLLATCRPTGIILLPAYLVLLLEKKYLWSPRAIIALCLAPLGALTYSWYLSSLTGDFLAFSHNQDAWGRNQQSLLDLLGGLLRNPGEWMKPWNFILLNAAAAALAIAAAVCLLKSKRYSLSLLVLLPTLAALSTGSVQSIGRFTMTLFPVFYVLSNWLRKESAERAVLILFALLLSIMVILYARHFTAAMA